MQGLYLRDSTRLLVIIGSLALSNIGCGSVNNGHPDAAAGGNIDAPVDATVTPRCDPAKPFGAPTLVANINGPGVDQGARLVDDLTLYFGSARPPSNTLGLYKATRSSPTSPFGDPVPLTAINVTGAASGPALTGDGLTMYYALIPAGQTTQKTADIYVTTRTDKTADFPAGTLVAGQFNSTIDDLDPFITEDDSALYFDSARGGNGLHLYVAVRQPGGTFGTPQALTDLNTTAIDGHPVLSQNGKTLYWSSTRMDVGFQGGTDIWAAKRPSTAGTFDAPFRVPELSSANNESMSWISPDGCLAYLQSDRPGGMGAQDIWQAVKPM